MKFNDFSAQDGSENDPKLAQDHSKTVPKAIIFHVEFLLQFWSVLGSVLAPFWHDVPLQILKQISMRFFLILVPFLTPQTLEFGALARAPCEFSQKRLI